MSKFKSAFMAYMDQNGIKYTDVNERRVDVKYSGDNLNTINVVVVFDEKDADAARFVCWGIGTFKDDKYPNAILVCNEMNAKYRWVKFYVDKDKDVAAELDAHFTEQSVGSVCMEIVRRVVNITDEVYPSFAKILFS